MKMWIIYPYKNEYFCFCKSDAEKFEEMTVKNMEFPCKGCFMKKKMVVVDAGSLADPLCMFKWNVNIRAYTIEHMTCNRIKHKSAPFMCRFQLYNKLFSAASSPSIFQFFVVVFFSKIGYSICLSMKKKPATTKWKEEKSQRNRI